IPQINKELTGHADGMVRFVDRNTILGSSRDDEYIYWTDKINKVIKEKSLSYFDVPFFGDCIYVNYLEVGDLIVLPVSEEKGNKDADTVTLFKHIFPERVIETINYNKIAKEGGLLNCTTWTVKE
ncbi:MAG: agmatine deiminase family protein, partial [Spirochaetia bacterium]|nr:agmatine deiminase family protein [Spirochaetia bacterium]